MFWGLRCLPPGRLPVLSVAWFVDDGARVRLGWSITVPRTLAGGLFVTLRMVKRAAIMHVHQQPISLVEVALMPDLHASCLVIARLLS